MAKRTFKKRTNVTNLQKLAKKIMRELNCDRRTAMMIAEDQTSKS